MRKWAGYFLISRITDYLNEANWVTLIDELDQIVGVIDVDQPYERVFRRGNLDTFEYNDETYSNAYIYIANFAPGAIDFDKFQNRLVNLFDVEPEAVTYTTQQQIIRDRPSVVATYTYGANNRIRVMLAGCASDSELCTRRESNTEVCGYLADNAVDWEPVE